jgi:hypothetical protein
VCVCVCVCLYNSITFLSLSLKHEDYVRFQDKELERVLLVYPTCI